MDDPSIDILEYIASDMDGTLLGKNHELTDQVLCSITDLHKTTSVSLILATGRCRRSAIEKLGTRDLDWSDKCGVFLNGAVVHGPGGGLVHETRFSFHEIEAVVSSFRNEGDRIVVLPCSGDEIHAPQICEISTFLHRDYADPYPIDHGSYEELLNHIQRTNLSIHMLSIATLDCRTTEQEVVTRVKEIMSRFGCLDDYSIVTPINRLVSILPKGTSKGAGLLALCKHMNVCPTRVAAIGDANNDVEMICCAGVGVAMGNAKENVKAHAKYVVNRNDDPDLPGVAQFIQWVMESKKV